jgi:L-amino acid N-acyltransferase YncA
LALRKAVESDLEAILAIFNHAVVNTTASFEIEPRSLAAEEGWFADHDPPYEVIVWEEGGVVKGWGSISRTMVRAAYRYSGELSVYVHPRCRRRGIGEALLSELMALGRASGFHTLVGFISTDNAPSIRLVEKLGFRQAGLLEEIGRKFDRWQSVAIYQIMC